MPLSINVSGVIFDMDGLVLDTERTFFMAWRQAANALGLSLTEAFCHSVSGLQGIDLQSRLSDEWGCQFNHGQFNRLATRFWRTYVETYGIDTRPGFHELLRAIKNLGLPYCLATNSSKTNALKCLSLASLAGVFETVISRDDVLNGKPEPDIFYVAANHINVPITHCLILEDSYSGIIAAKRAGGVPIWIPSVPITEDMKKSVNVDVFDSLADVISLLTDVTQSH